MCACVRVCVSVCACAVSCVTSPSSVRCDSRCVCSSSCDFVFELDHSPVACSFTHTQVNHLKFLGEAEASKTAIQWPKKRADGLPLVANFFFEPQRTFEAYTTSPAITYVHHNAAPVAVSPLTIQHFPVALCGCSWKH